MPPVNLRPVNLKQVDWLIISLRIIYLDAFSKAFKKYLPVNLKIRFEKLKNRFIVQGMNTPYTPKKPVLTDWHRADIKAALEKAGWSLRKLAEHHGYAPSTLINALAGQYPNAERIIAEAIGKHPKEIWPSRYDADGVPLKLKAFPRTRPAHWAKPGKKPCIKDTASDAAINGNVEGRK